MTSLIELLDDSIDLALEEGLIDQEEADTARLYTSLESKNEEEQALALVTLLAKSHPPEFDTEDADFSSSVDYEDTVVSMSQVNKAE